MTKDNLTKSIDTELIKEAMYKILKDLKKADIMYTSKKPLDYDIFYQEIQIKANYVNQLDIEFHDYWYHIARNMLNGIKPTDQEIDNLHDYANAIIDITW